MEQKCITCNADLATSDGSVTFPCPSCGEETIGRCGNCRASTKPWKCKCGFEGP